MPSKKKNSALQYKILEEAIGKNRSFATMEAHKRLRTNLMFSFSGEKECRVVGVTSTLAHEGKSTTAINLAYDLMQAGKKVLLIDADMRLSRVAKILGVARTPGLSNMLVGNNKGESLIQRSPIHGGLSVITCGDVPPNPTELLSSKRMSNFLEALKSMFNYIIIDLPPVSEVADAMIVSKLTDGMIVVVRQDYADRKLLEDTVEQLKFNEANIIGFVMTCVKSAKNNYYKYKYKYKNHYEYSGADAAE